MHAGTFPRSKVVLVREPPFRLGPITIEPALRQISYQERREILEPRIMQVLIALAQAPGVILSRDDLVTRCWDGRVVGDNAIHRAISKLRELGLSLDGAFEVETITKVGYRLLLRSVVATPPAGARSDLSRRHIVAFAGSAVAVTAGALWWSPWQPRRDARVNALLAQGQLAMRNALPDSTTKGIAFFEEAARLAPQDAAVWGKLALARTSVAEYSPPETVTMAVQAAEEAARRALALDRSQIDARAALAILPPIYGDWTAAEARLRAVLASDPDHLPARDALDFLLVAVGRSREGAGDRIVIGEREPLDAAQQYRLVYGYWLLGRIGDADRTAERALSLWPKHPGVWFVRLWTFAFTGRAKRALAHLDEADTRPDLAPGFVAALRAAMIAIDSKAPADRRQAVDHLLRLLSASPSHSVNAIMLLNAMGEIDRAFDVANAYLLEQGPLTATVRWKKGGLSINDEHHRKTNQLFVPVCAPMWKDKRFLPLMDAIGLTRYWRAVGKKPDFMG